MKTPLLPLALAAACFLAAGCQTDETGAFPPVNTTKFDTENRERFVLMDRGARNSITCSGLQEGATPDGRLAVAANVRNRENRRIQVQINCEFKDAQGFVTEATPWETLILTENGQETKRYEAMNERAKRYTIRVREAR